MSRSFKNRKANNWCQLCQRTVHELAEHMQEHYDNFLNSPKN